MSFNICIAIPIESGDILENREAIEKALSLNPEFIEFRFDYISDFRMITQEFASKIVNLVGFNKPIIATFRDPSEGGQLNIDNKERRKILQSLIKAQPTYVDIEMNFDKNILNDLVRLSCERSVRVVFSYHDFEKTPSYEDGIKMVKSFIIKLKDALSKEIEELEDFIIKIVFTAKIFEDNFNALKLCNTLSNEGQKVICFCMGEIGILSRIACVKVGSFLTFSSFDRKTASGQINIEKMREIHKMLFFD